MLLQERRRAANDPGGARSPARRSAESPGPATDRPARHGRMRPSWPLLMAAIVVGSGLAYTLWWPAVVRHHPEYWITPPDLWATVRAAHWVSWGDLPYVYSANSGLVTLPGYPILIAPVVALVSALGMPISVPPYFLFRPTAWYLIGPFVLASSGLALVAFDRLAARLGATSRRRAFLAVAAAAALWPSLALWGHPEDVLAVGLCALALLAAFDGRVGKAGWLLGGALCMQLLAILALPVVLGAVGPRRSWALLWRAGFLPGVLAAAVLVPNFEQSWRVLTQQPNFPGVDHPTPWVLMSTTLAPGVVSAGPGRLLGLAAAAACGAVAWRRRHDLLAVAWLAALAMAARCAFEAVMDPYYLTPAVVLALVVAAARGGLPLALTALAGAALTVVSYSHADMWAWWLEVTALTTATITCAGGGGRLAASAARRLARLRWPALRGLALAPASRRAG